MDEKLNELLGEEISREISNLKNLTSGSEEHAKAVESLTKLYKLKIEETKNQWDYSEKFERFEKEFELKKDELEDRKKEQNIKFGIDVSGIVLPLIFYGIWMNRGFRFEETGTITSHVFRGLIQKFKPAK